MPSVFIHIMPPAALHCIVHLTPAQMLKERFPAVYNVKFSDPGSPEHYSLLSMMTWATVPYFTWQMAYLFLISVRRAEKIAAGRPTSFTWLRKSYAKAWIGKIVLSFPESLQEPAFMLVQYIYALLTMIPCPIWFWYRWASAIFLMTMFVWSVHNGATYYIDIFGKRFQRELEELKRDVARWQSTPEGSTTPFTPFMESTNASSAEGPLTNGSESDKTGLDQIPPLEPPASSGVESANPLEDSIIRKRT